VSYFVFVSRVALIVVSRVAAESRRAVAWTVPALVDRRTDPFTSSLATAGFPE